MALASRRNPADEIDSSFETFSDILEALNDLRLKLENGPVAQPPKTAASLRPFQHARKVICGRLHLA